MIGGVRCGEKIIFYPRDDWETQRKDEVVCPYCHYEHGDSWEWFGDGTDCADVECENCGLRFSAWVNVEVTYSSSRQKQADQWV